MMDTLQDIREETQAEGERLEMIERYHSQVAVTAAIQAGEVPHVQVTKGPVIRDGDVITGLPGGPHGAELPMAWIIERDGRVTMIHDGVCANHAAENGYIVTSYYSKVPR